MASKKNGRYEAGQLAADIAYIKAGLMDLNDKWEGMENWVRGVEARLAVGSEIFASLKKADETNAEAVKAQAKRVDDVLREGRLTTFFGTVLASIIGMFVSPQK